MPASFLEKAVYSFFPQLRRNQSGQWHSVVSCGMIESIPALAAFQDSLVHAFLRDHPFLDKHQAKIAAVLSCFDRIILRGYLPICHPGGVEGWLYHQQVPLKSFKDFAPKLAERLLNHAKQLAQSQQRPYQYLPTRQSKEELARQIAQRDGVREGLVCVFSCLETCRTFRLQWGKGRLRLRPDLRRCTVLYYFFLDPDCGLIHVKLHTWLPLTCQVYLNGHSWLERQMREKQVPFAAVDNAFVSLPDAEAAQRLADRLVRQNWRRRLDHWAHLVNPLLGKELGRHQYYWVVDQAEFSTDVLFKSPEALASLYPSLVEQATLHFSSEDVLRFLGRKLTGHFQGTVQTEHKRLPVEPTSPRPRSHKRGANGMRMERIRVKHAMKTNRLKMYDKEGVVLRIETVINDPTEFRVRRAEKHGGGQRISWQPMRKSVCWLWRYAEVALASNRRYLEALSVVEDRGPARQQLERVCEPVSCGGRRRRGLQPLSPQDQALFLAVLRGEHHLQGLRNKDIARQLYGEGKVDWVTRRRRSARVTRLIQLLRGHKLLAKVPRARRYRVTALGQALMSAAVRVKERVFPQEIANVG
jgi:hypothetical protein